MKIHPEARVTVTGGGVGVGISALLDGTADLAMASALHQVQRKMRAKAAGKNIRETSHRWRRPLPWWSVLTIRSTG